MGKEVLQIEEKINLTKNVILWFLRGNLPSLVNTPWLTVTIDRFAITIYWDKNKVCTIDHSSNDDDSPILTYDSWWLETLREYEKL